MTDLEDEFKEKFAKHTLYNAKYIEETRTEDIPGIGEIFTWTKQKIREAVEETKRNYEG